MSHVSVIPQEIEQAYRQCTSQWTGCDWATKFGKTGLNLRNLKASRALLMARATSGDEKADWHAAVEWLSKIERQACDAEHEARLALTHVCEGSMNEALQHARRACEIEKEHHPCPIWVVFMEAVERTATVPTFGK